MNFKKLLILLVVLIPLSIYSENKIEFRMDADIRTCPLLYQYQYNQYGASLDGSFFGGVNFSKFTLGAQADVKYYGLKSPDIISNAVFSVRGSFIMYYKPLSWFELKAGLGGAWQSTRVGYTYKGDLLERAGAPSILCDLSFFPWKYITITHFNTLDIFITEHSMVLPIYECGVRASFNPYLTWIALFTDVGIRTMFYKDIDVNIESVSFVWNVGVSFDIKLPSTAKYMGKLKEKVDDTKDIKKSAKTSTGKDKKLVEALKDAEVGDEFEFSSICFFPDSDKIIQESIPIVKDISEVLKTKEEFIIEVSGYTNSVGDKKEELALSVQRAVQIINYLAQNGVDYYRMKAAGYGGMAARDQSINVDNRKVIIKVIARDYRRNEK